MKTQFNTKWYINGCIIACVGFLLISYYVNKKIHSITEIPSSSTESFQTANKPKKEALQKEMMQKGALRRESKNPKNSYTESIITVDEKEVARFKKKDGKIFDVQGQIPDGKIKFTNKWESTYGFEHFHKGKRDGPFTAYYQNGRIHSEASYKNGRLIKRKSYYHGGVLRMEEDYTNTNYVSTFLQGTFKRVGRGKIYRLNGSLKYEWYVTDDAEQFYTKRYNSKGKIVQENFYNRQGEVIKKQQDLNESPPGSGAEAPL